MVIAFAFGAVGGSVWPLIHKTQRQHRTGEAEWSARDVTRFVGTVAESCWIGGVGSLGFVFIEASLGAIQSPLTGQQVIRLAALSVVAGFGARKLLPLITDQLSRRVEQHERLLREAQREIESQKNRNMEVQKELSSLEDYKEHTEIEQDLINVLDGHASMSSYPDLLDRAHRLIENGKAKSSLVTWYAMYLKRQGKLGEAIDALSAYLERDPRPGRNHGRIRYNLGCYLALRASTTGDASDERNAVANLKAALSSEADRELLIRHARIDPDLEWLRNRSDEVRKLLGAPEGAPEQ